MKTGPKPRPPHLRVIARTTRVGDCWVHEKPAQHDGYARVNIGSRSDGTRRIVMAHRVVYEALVGPIPEGLDLDHLCRVRACVNPDHLEPVTRRRNLLRGETITATKAEQTHCVNGHEFTPANTYTRSNGCRTCRRCKADQQARRRARRRAAPA